MKWKKIGLVHSPARKHWWDHSYAMMPTPYHFPAKGIIRVFYGVTDVDKFGRTAFVDVSDKDPSCIVGQSGSYVLDLGLPGTFDDSGAVPSSIISRNGELYLYYVGFQRVQKVPYMLFSGLAHSTDGIDFIRYSQSPIIDRNPYNVFSNAAPFVLYDAEESLYKMWFWLGMHWVEINKKLYINAQIRYATSTDAVTWRIEASPCIDPDPASEFSVGRPWVIKEGGMYKMFYSVRYIDKLYRLGYAESADGKRWTRKDDEIGLNVSSEGWDSEMMCYPSVITVHGNTYLFYNGNNNGETGFGVAILTEK